MRRIPVVVLAAALALASCTEQDTFGSPDDTPAPGPSTSTTLRVDRPDDTVDPTSPVDVTTPVDDEVVEQPEITGQATVQIAGRRYQVDVFVSHCTFDRDGAWDVNGTTVVDDVTVGFSASYQLVPGVDEADDTWELFVYLSFALGEQGAYQHYHATAPDASADGTDVAAGPPQQARPSLATSPDRMQVRAEFIDPTGQLLDAGETTPGRVDVVCTA